MCYGDCALRADEGRWLASGAGMPERRAEPVVGRSSRGDGMCLQLLRPMVSKRQRPLYDPVRRLYLQVRAIRMPVPFGTMHSAYLEKFLAVLRKAGMPE